MADDPAARREPDSSEDPPRTGAGDAEGGLELLHRLSVRTKALVISSEYTRRQMEPEELCRILEVLAPTPEERQKAIQAVEEELRAARYPMGEIVRLVSGLAAPARAEEKSASLPPSQDPLVVVTRKVRSPNLMPFERFEFEAPDTPSAREAGEGPARPSMETSPAAAEPSSPESDQKPPDESPGEALEWEVEEEFEVKPGGEIEPRSRQETGARREGKAEPVGKEEPEAKEEPGGNQAGERPAAAGVSPHRPEVRPAGAPPQLRFVSGGESAPPEAKGFAEGLKGLAGVGVGSAPRSDLAPGGGTRGPAVLVADDDGRARMMYRAKLEESGFAVVEAKDGIEAWNHIHGGAVQCAVMDMKMPGYHGLEVLGRMVDSNVIIPVVVVSAFDQLANEFVVATYPKLRFLTKPASPERVVEAVKSFLRPGKRAET